MLHCKVKQGDDMSDDLFKEIGGQELNKRKAEVSSAEREAVNKIIVEHEARRAVEAQSKQENQLPLEVSTALAGLAAKIKARIGDKTETQVVQQSYFVRRRIMGTLHDLGASYTQIGNLYNLSRGSVFAAVMREIKAGAKRKHSPTGHADRLPFEQVVWYKSQLDLRPDIPATLGPEQAAEWVLTNCPYPDD